MHKYHNRVNIVRAYLCKHKKKSFFLLVFLFTSSLKTIRLRILLYTFVVILFVVFAYSPSFLLSDSALLVSLEFKIHSY